MIERYLSKLIYSDLQDKMVFIGGPRQVGKKTLVRTIGEQHYAGKFTYLNWDNRLDRKTILKQEFQGVNELVIFDEIHKYKKWKNYIKGEYDKNKDEFKIIVTGSSRLDMYRKHGDSMLGRYFYFRIHPLSVAELTKSINEYDPFSKLSFNKPETKITNIFNDLYKYGGFPEMYIKKDENKLARWHNSRVENIIREDIRDIASIRDLGTLELLAEIIPEKVGSLLSINSLIGDLQVSFKTIRAWIECLEQVYYLFRIYPFQSKLIKSLKKEPKVYLWDWSQLKEEGPKLENIVASHLLKFCHYLHDVKGYKTDLRFLRDKEQREVDFLVTIDNKPWFCVEVKNSRREISKSLYYYKSTLKIPYSYQIVLEDGVNYVKEGIHVMDVPTFLSSLY
jgi:predicted AAA+ superfamily ATPase